jgi:hypothetical protein
MLAVVLCLEVCLLPLHSTSGAQVVSKSLLEPQPTDVSMSARSNEGLASAAIVATHRAARDERVRSGRDEAGLVRGLVGVRIIAIARVHVDYRAQQSSRACASAIAFSQGVGVEVVGVMHVRNTSGHMGHV